MRTSKKRQGITLVELLVAILCSTLAITMVISSVFFITGSTKDLIDESESLYKVQKLEKDIRALCESEGLTALETELASEKADNVRIIYLQANGIDTTGLKAVHCDREDKIVRCHIEYEGRAFSFVLGVDGVALLPDLTS